MARGENNKKRRLRVATDPDPRIAELLTLYPGVSDQERLEIKLFLDVACPLELERLRKTRGLRAKLDQFRKDHPDRRRLTWAETLALAVLGILLVACCWILWL